VLLQQEGQGKGAFFNWCTGRGGAGRQARAGRRAGRQEAQQADTRLGRQTVGRQLGTQEAGRLTGHREQVLLLVAASAGPRKEPGRHWVQAWWEEGPTSLPWPQAVQVALAVKALRNLPLSQAAQESGHQRWSWQAQSRPCRGCKPPCRREVQTC
jgi:hypothetical protein